MLLDDGWYFGMEQQCYWMMVGILVWSNYFKNITEDYYNNRATSKGVHRR